MTATTADKDTSPTQQNPAPTIIEWSMRGLSALILMLLFGFLVYGTMQPAVGPNFVMSVQHEKIEQRRNGWAVPITITNKGTVAIGDVIYQVMGTASDGSPLNTKQGRIAILGSGESVDAEVWFARDPHGAELRLQVDTYTL